MMNNVVTYERHKGHTSCLKVVHEPDGYYLAIDGRNLESSPSVFVLFFEPASDWQSATIESIDRDYIAKVFDFYFNVPEKHILVASAINTPDYSTYMFAPCVWFPGKQRFNAEFHVLANTPEYAIVSELSKMERRALK